MPKVAEQLFTRPPWDRMMQIHERIKSGKHPNCTILSKETEVSPRTIKRDIDFMRCRLNLPIEYDGQQHGYFYTAPVDAFPGLAMTEAEIFALLVAHKAIAQYRGTPFQRPLQTAFDKLTARLGKSADFSLSGMDQAFSFRPFAPEDADLELFRLLTSALKERREIRFLYRNLGTAKPRARQARPYHLACIDNHWYLFAFDVNRQAIRTFVLTRISQLQVTKLSFQPDRGFDPDVYLRDSFAVFKGKDDFEIVVLFDRWAADQIRGRQWHPGQEILDLPDGSLRLRMRLNSVEEMEHWVLGWGAHATVIRPQTLVERIRATAQELNQRYSNSV